MVLTFTSWFSKSRITLSEKHFKVISNNIVHSIPSAKSQKMRLWLLGSTELCEIIDVGAEIKVQSMLNALERRHCVLHMWTPYERWYHRKQEVHLIRAGFVFHPELLDKKGPATRSQVRESTWIAKSTTTANQLQKRCRKKKYDNIHDRFNPRQVPSEKRWSSWVALKRSFLRWIGLQAKTTVILPQKEEIDVYRGNWWIRSNVVNFDTDAHKASTWLQESIVDIVPPKESGGQEALWKSGHKVPPHGGGGKQPGGKTRLWEFSTEMEWALIERWNLCTRWATIHLLAWISARIECKIYREYIGHSWQQSTVTDGRCK